jgi:hypothetical protein
MKETRYQKDLNIIPDMPLEEIIIRFFWIKENIADMSRRIKDQGALLKETAGLLEGIRATLFEMKQGELFDDENIGTVEDKAGCKDEVFGELRELLGNEQAEKVADYFSGSLVYFSKNIVIARKYQEIRKAFQEGTNYRDLGIKYGYTEQHIRNIVHREGKTK